MGLLSKQLYASKPVLPDTGSNGLSSWEEDIFSRNCMGNWGGAYAAELLNSREICNPNTWKHFY